MYQFYSATPTCIEPQPTACKASALLIDRERGIKRQLLQEGPPLSVGLTPFAKICGRKAREKEASGSPQRIAELHNFTENRTCILTVKDWMLQTTNNTFLFLRDKEPSKLGLQYLDNVSLLKRNCSIAKNYTVQESYYLCLFQWKDSQSRIRS